MLTLCIRGDSMIELITKYKVAILFLILVIANIGWYMVKDYQTRAIAVEMHSQPIQNSSQNTATDDTESYTSHALPVTIEDEPKQNQQVTKYEVSCNAQTNTKVPIYICGEVVNPGVYYTNQTAIMDDVIQMSGGYTTDADENYLNLAAPIASNQKIYVPKKGEIVDTNLEEGNNNQDQILGSMRAIEPSASNDSLVNINLADETELQTLTGIGLVKAKSIIAYRTTNGRFKTIDELLNVSGIGEKTLEKIRAFITL